MSKKNNSKAEEDRKKMEEALKAEEEEAAKKKLVEAPPPVAGSAARQRPRNLEDVREGLSVARNRETGEVLCFSAHKDVAPTDNAEASSQMEASPRVLQQQHASGVAAEKASKTGAGTTAVSVIQLKGADAKKAQSKAAAQGGGGGMMLDIAVRAFESAPKHKIDAVFIADDALSNEAMMAVELKSDAPPLAIDTQVVRGTVALTTGGFFTVECNRTALSANGPRCVMRGVATAQPPVGVEVYLAPGGGLNNGDAWWATVLLHGEAFPFSLLGGEGRGKGEWAVYKAQKVATRYGDSIMCLLNKTNGSSKYYMQLWCRPNQVDLDLGPVGVTLGNVLYQRKEDFQGKACFAVRTFGRLSTITFQYMEVGRSLF
jgi:hypothetical protein